MLINKVGFDFLEEYVGNDFEIVFLLEYNPALKPGINIVLGYTENEKEEKNYFILFKHNFGRTKKIEIAAADGQYIEKILRSGRISIMPPEEFGLDGHSYMFTFFNNGNFAQYRWWGDPDENWSLFGEVADIVFKYIKNSDGYER